MLGVVLLAVDLPADAVLLAIDAPPLRRRQRAAVGGAIALDLAVDARFLALQAGRLARGELAALHALGDALLLPPLAPVHFRGARRYRNAQHHSQHHHRRSLHRVLPQGHVPRET